MYWLMNFSHTHTQKKKKTLSLSLTYLHLVQQVASTQMVGSFGYSAPEFALSGLYTVKSDVYSFGVVMLELLTGRKPLDRYNLFCNGKKFISTNFFSSTMQYYELWQVDPEGYLNLILS